MQLDMTNVAVVYMTVETDKSRVEQDPPQLPFMVANNPGAKAAILDSFKQSAHNYDAYNDIVQLSFYYQGSFVHTMYCADPAVRIEDPVGKPGQVITTVDSEERLIESAAMFINQIYLETHDGITVDPVTFAGWKINTDVWPRFVNKALKYDVRIPSSLMGDPLRRFPQVNNLLDMSNIYAQGASMALRKLPALADVLKYWGYRGDDDKPRHPQPENVLETVCTEPLTAARDVEIYLRDMYDLLCRYYRYDKPESLTGD